MQHRSSRALFLILKGYDLAVELRHLRYFLAAAESGNFRRAAESLNITQPPLSRAIRELEQQLGQTLFDRSRIGSTLTPAGERLVAEARSILGQSDALVQRFNAMRKARDGTLNIGYAGSTIATTLPRVIREFRGGAYDCDIHLHALNKIEQVNALRAGIIDVGLSRAYPEVSDIATEIILEEPLLVAISESDPRSRRSSLTASALADDRLILFPSHPRPSFPEVIIETLQLHGVTPFDQLVVDDLISCLGLVAAGTGVSIVPYSAMEYSVESVRYVSLDGVSRRARQLVAFRKFEASPPIRAFVEVCRRIQSLVTPATPEPR